MVEVQFPFMSTSVVPLPQPCPEFKQRYLASSLVGLRSSQAAAKSDIGAYCRAVTLLGWALESIGNQYSKSKISVPCSLSPLDIVLVR